MVFHKYEIRDPMLIFFCQRSVLSFGSDPAAQFRSHATHLAVRSLCVLVPPGLVWEAGLLRLPTQSSLLAFHHSLVFLRTDDRLAEQVFDGVVSLFYKSRGGGSSCVCSSVK